MTYIVVLMAITKREAFRFLQQKGRFVSALVRPLVWLFVFAAGFRAALGLSIMPPYQTYIQYETYIVPGLCGMILLFNGMQSSFSLIYDREMGSMKLLFTSPLPRWWLLLCKLIGSVFVSLLQVYVFLFITFLYGIRIPEIGYLTAFPAFIVAGFLMGSLGLFLSSFIRQLENFAGVMNFIIFPMFFLSSALYPLWKMSESSKLLHDICVLNPFTHAVELIRFALYGQWNSSAFLITMCAAIVFFGLAEWGYNPTKVSKKGNI
ncbi:MAG: ABC transporter permease [Aestuariivita sp.]|nr:ABC transporter permease [Aestuariivita sp.]